ncbi:MAG: protein O-mannosyl-transferase family [Anaerolineae bacterium]
MRTAAHPRPEVLAGVVVLAAALCLYLLTLDNGLRLDELKGGDLITHQYAQVEGRPSNAPGYPLYTMGGWLWFRLGRAILGGLLSPVEVLSLYSTAWAMLALALLYVLALQVGGGRWPLAAAATAFYAVTYFFWYYAVSTEQYASAVFQTLLLVLLALLWQRRRHDRYLHWMAFVAGTCLANLVTVAFIVPGLIWFVLSQEPGILCRRGLLLRLLALALLPLLAYVYVYVRGAQHPEWRGQGDWPSTLSWFISFLSTGQGRQEMTLSLWPVDLKYLLLMADELTWPVLLAGLAGLALLERHQAVLAYATVAVYLLFSYVDRYGNWFQVIMPVYALLVLGCVSLARFVVDRAGGRRPLVAAVAVLLVVAAGERLLTNYPRSDLRDRADDNALCAGQAVLLDLAGEPAPVAVAVTYDEQVSLQYLATVYGVGHDVVAVPPTDVGDAVGYLTRGALPLAQPLPIGWARPRALGAEVLARTDGGNAAEAGAVEAGPLDASIASYQVRRRQPACGGDLAVVQVLWTVREPVGADIVVSARPLVDGVPLAGDGRPLQDDHPPLWSAVSTVDWAVGERWLDSYSFPLPDGATANGLRLLAYTAGSAGAEVLWSVDLTLPASSRLDQALRAGE